MDEPAPTTPRPLHIGDMAPDFQARSTTGPVEMARFRGRWLVFFSHPADFTPVCTTEFVAFAKASTRFEALDCALMALSVDSLYAHFAWVKAIHDRFGVEVRFPIVEDPTLVVGRAYGMVGDDAGDAASVRSMFIIDPAGVIRAMSCYPVEVGRSVDEIVRTVAALQSSDAKSALAPEGWQPGDRLMKQAEPTLETLFDAADETAWFIAEQDDE